MAAIPRAYVDRFTKLVNITSDDAQKKLAKALTKVEITDIAAARDEIIAIMDAILGPYTDNVAAIAATFYDGLREWSGVVDDFEAEPISNRDPAATDGAVRAFMQTQVDGKPFDELQTLLMERADYEVKRAANECIAANCKRDPKRPKWARIPTGADTCDFCIMLASRGFTYQSAETASHAHANCDCRIVPSWDKKNPAVEGYDPDEYYEQYIDSGFKGGGSGGKSERAAKDLGNGGKFNGINEMNAYLEESKTLDELYARADEVLKEINELWNGNANMFSSASRTAKEMRKRLR